MPIDVIIVGGYLGSGKSSLVNHILGSSDKSEIGVIVNDLAPVNVDADHVIQEAGFTVGIQDGCVCCSVGDRLCEAFEWMVAFRPRLKRILVEASGVGDPQRISYYVHGIRDLDLRAMVTVADASMLVERLHDKFVGSLVNQQIRVASLLVVNKIDLVPAERLSRVEAVLRGLNTDAPIVRARHGGVDAGALFSRPIISQGVKPRAFPAASDPGDAGAKFRTMVLRTRQRVDRTEFVQTLQRLTEFTERIKGVVVTSEKEMSQYLVQASRMDLRLTPAESSAVYKESVLVFILSGADADADARQKSIELALAGNDWRANVITS